ncbi:MAG: sugar ABC transporter permease [Clostridiales Family XIII bacterium]|jgi:putative multiple sugar transport system permease protein|nr:sugar ABC transporter permease [Clostridiales Family XIII bacterium]
MPKDRVEKRAALKAFDLKKNMMLLALVVAMVAFEILIRVNHKGAFFTPANVTNLILQNGYVVILAVGMLLCILTGGNIDLAVGSVLCMISAIAGVLIVNMGVNIYLAIIICLLIGTAAGAIQGYFIAYVRIPAFIVTLAGMLTFRGIGYIILKGFTISPFPKSFTRIFNGFLPSMPAQVPLRTTTPGTFDGDPDKLAENLKYFLSENDLTAKQAADMSTSELRDMLEAHNSALLKEQILITMIVAVVLVALFVILNSVSRIRRAKKGMPLEPGYSFGIKLAVVVAVVLFGFWLFGQNKGIPVILITLGIIVFVYHYFTSKTVPGRHLYAMGGNEKATVFSGINTNRLMFFAYTNMGFLTAVAALVCIARFNSAAPSAGDGYELDAIGSCFIGGASAYGGVGTVSGTVIGAIFMGVLNNGMSILGIDQNWQRAVKGVVLLLAVLVDVATQKQRGGGRRIFGGMFKGKDKDGEAAESGAEPAPEGAE